MPRNGIHSFTTPAFERDQCRVPVGNLQVAVMSLVVVHHGTHVSFDSAVRREPRIIPETTPAVNVCHLIYTKVSGAIDARATVQMPTFGERRPFPGQPLSPFSKCFVFEFFGGTMR